MSEKKVRIDADAHSVESVLADSLHVLGVEMKRLRATCSAGLDVEKAKQLSLYVDLALRLSKEQRDSTMNGRLDELSDDKLDALLSEATKYAAKRRGA